MEKREPRQKSNVKNVVKSAIGIIILIVTAILVFRYGIENIVGSISIFSLMIGILILLWGVSDYYTIWKENKDLEKLPYKFDIDYELKIYTSIGNIVNKDMDNKIVPEIITYSAWSKHIRDNYKELFKGEDFKRYLIDKKRSASIWVDDIKTFLIPVELAIVASSFSFETFEYEWMNVIGMIIVTFALVVIIGKELSAYEQRLNFFEDLIEVVSSGEEPSSDDGEK